MNAFELAKLKQVKTKVSKLYKKFPLGRISDDINSFNRSLNSSNARIYGGFGQNNPYTIILNRNAIITGLIVDE